jgi:hypothetical protein
MLRHLKHAYGLLREHSQTKFTREGGEASGLKAPSIPEVSLSTCTPEIFGRAMIDHGVIILRSAIDRGKISYYRERIDKAIAFYAKLTEDEIEKLDYQRWWPGNAVSFVLNQAQLGYINDEMLKDATDGALSFYDLISDPAFHALVAGAFPASIFQKSAVTVCRRVTPHGVYGSGWSAPVELHCDLRYHKSAPYGLNFWIPLEAAGQKFGRPGLEVAPFGFRAVAKYLEYDGNWSAAFDDAKFDTQRIAATFGSDALKRTDIDVGDVMVFTVWTLHRTYVPAGATEGRLSAEVRVVSDALPAGTA